MINLLYIYILIRVNPGLFVLLMEKIHAGLHTIPYILLWSFYNRDINTTSKQILHTTTTPTHSAVCSFSVLSVSLGSFHSAAIVEYTQQSELIEFRLLGDEPSSFPFTYGYRYLFTWGNNSSGQVLKYSTIILLYIELYTICIYYILYITLLNFII